jgi:hypothetical protein
MDEAKDGSLGLLKASRSTIQYPAGGEVYAFTLEGLAADNWRGHLLKDTLSWITKANLEKNDAATNLEKTVYACRLATRFKRLVYHDKSSGKVLVHYHGDGSKIERKPHGNSKGSKEPFFATSSLVREAIIRQGDVRPRRVMEAFRETGLVREVMAPRNANQVKYEQKKKRDQKKLALEPIIIPNLNKENRT